MLGLGWAIPTVGVLPCRAATTGTCRTAAPSHFGGGLPLLRLRLFCSVSSRWHAPSMNAAGAHRRIMNWDITTPSINAGGEVLWPAELHLREQGATAHGAEARRGGAAGNGHPVAR